MLVLGLSCGSQRIKAEMLVLGLACVSQRIKAEMLVLGLVCVKELKLRCWFWDLFVSKN